MIDVGSLFSAYAADPFAAGPLKPLLAVWLAAIGGAVGSFLNVVVYRVPAGKSLISPGSHCPICGHPIRWYDNVPMLGWLMLRGRCRDCRTPISARYPTIEAVGAVLFVALGLAEFLACGDRLPLRAVAVVGGTVRPMLSGPELAGRLAYHLFLFSSLLAAVLIEYDGFRLPRKVLGPALAVGVLCPLAWPHLHPVPAGPPLDGWVGGLADAAAGLTAGALLGLAAWPFITPARRFGLLGYLACTGVFLGWQAATALAAITFVLHVLWQVPARFVPTLQRVPPTTWLAVSGVAWIVAWRPLLTAWPF